MKKILASLIGGLFFVSVATAGVTIFAISGQSPGHVEFSVAVDGNHAPSNLLVTSRCFDNNSQIISSQDANVANWVDDNGVLVGFVSFDGPSGQSCYAFVHKSGSSKSLATFSYISP